MTHSNIIKLLLTEGKRKYDRLSETSGISVPELIRFKHRGSVPSRHWAAFVTAAEKLDVEGVTYEALAKGAAQAAAA